MVARILALLEHPDHVIQVRDCLEHAGHEVEVVDSFTRATESLSDCSFDLIMSDVHLENGGSVFDFLRWTKSQRHLQAVPFVLFDLRPTEMSKYLTDAVRTSARALGAARHITMDTFDCHRLNTLVVELLPDAAVVAANGHVGA